MKNNFIFNDWTNLSLRVMSIFAVAIVLSFLPNYLHDFFGDIKYGTPNSYSMIDNDYEWGFRHILYHIMCIILFIIQVVRIGAWASNREFKA